MLFHVVPEDIFRDRAVYSRPCCCQKSPRCRQQQFGNMGFLRDVLRPLIMMSHNNSGSEGCHGSRLCDTEICQFVTRSDAQKGACPAQKRQPESMTASLNFSGFAAEEIKVKVTDNSIIVCGQHDDPRNSFRATRRLPLPAGIDKAGVICRYVDGKIILEFPASAKDSVEDNPERQEDEKKAEHNDKARSDPLRTSDTGDDEDDGGMEIEKEDQEAFQEGIEHLTGVFSALFGLPLWVKKDKTDMPDGSPDKVEDPAEQTTTDKDKDEPHPDEEKHKTVDGSFGKQMDVEEEKSEEEKEQEDTCLMLKSDEDPSVKGDTDDPTHVEEPTTGDSALPEQTKVRKMEESEKVERLMSDGGEDAEKTQFNVDGDLPISSTSVDFEIRLDLSNYKPEDIRVVVRNGDVIVEAERERKCDGYSETETLRKCIRLPDKVDQSMLTSVLNEEGEMTIQAPFESQTSTEKEEKNIPVVCE